MTRDQFDAMVSRLEVSANANPGRYTLRVITLVLLAYAYLAFVLLLTLGFIAVVITLIVIKPNAATIKLGGAFGLLAAGLAWAIIKGLWVTIEPPTGIHVRRQQAPELFAMLDRLREELKSQPFDVVLLTGDYNAAVVQAPRLGMFGWHRNYLLLGLPLMQSLGPDEFKAVLAHEFAHLSGGHGRFGNWLYRVRRSWDRIFDQMARQQSGGSWVLTSFIKWYWPKFNAHAFVLSRANEYEADACAARLVSATAIADALTRIQVHAQLIDDRIWPDVFKRASAQEIPPQNVFDEMRSAIANGAPEADVSRWLRHAFHRETNNADTHPSLTDRLRSVGRLPPPPVQGQSANWQMPPIPAQTAATAFLAEAEPTVTAELNAQWRAHVTPMWAKRFQDTRKTVEELQTLEKGTEEQPTAESLWKRITLKLDLEGENGIEPALDQLLAQEPQHAGGNFLRGRTLLDRDEPSGLEFMERALAEDPSLTGDACNVMAGHFIRTHQRDRVRELEGRMEKHHEIEQLAHNERNDIRASDTFLPHDLKPSHIEHLSEILANEKEVATAHVARKEMQHFPKLPCYVIALELDVPWHSFRSQAENPKLCSRVVERLRLPGYFVVFVAEGELKPLAKKIRTAGNSLVYQATGK